MAANVRGGNKGNSKNSTEPMGRHWPRVQLLCRMLKIGGMLAAVARLPSFLWFLWSRCHAHSSLTEISVQFMPCPFSALLCPLKDPPAPLLFPQSFRTHLHLSSLFRSATAVLLVSCVFVFVCLFSPSSLLSIHLLTTV